MNILKKIFSFLSISSKNSQLSNQTFDKMVTTESKKVIEETTIKDKVVEGKTVNEKDEQDIPEKDNLEKKLKELGIENLKLTDNTDTGLRGSSRGELYVNKSVFFHRRDVIVNLLNLMESNK